MIDGQAATSQTRLVAGYFASIDVSTQHDLASRVCCLPNKGQTGAGRLSAIPSGSLFRLSPTLGCLRAMRDVAPTRRCRVWR